MLPSELISHIMKNCDLKTVTRFLVVNKELYQEAKRQLTPLITIKDDTRIEAIQGKEFMIVSVYIVGDFEGFNNGGAIKGKNGGNYRGYQEGKNEGVKGKNNGGAMDRGNKKGNNKEDNEESGNKKEEGNKGAKEYLRSRKYFKWIDGKWKLHGENKPAVTEWHWNDWKAYEKWYKDGKQSRDNGPAETRWDLNGVTFKKWFRDGQLHRNKKPAIEQWDENGVKFYEAWYEYDKLIKNRPNK